MVQITAVVLAFASAITVSAAPAFNPSTGAEIRERAIPHSGKGLVRSSIPGLYPKPTVPRASSKGHSAKGHSASRKSSTRKREFEQAELAEREPFFPLLFGAFKAVKGVVSAVRNRNKREFEDELSLRESEDLDERDVFLPWVLNAREDMVMEARKLDDVDLYDRELAGLEEREIDELD